MTSERGAPKSEIRGSDDFNKFASFNLDPVVPSNTDHPVLYKFRRGYRPGVDWLEPYPGVDKWDNSYVRMPHSPYNQDKNERGYEEQRWGKIYGALLNVANKQIRNSRDLQDTILSYNHRYRNEWKFSALHAFCNHLNDDEKELFFNTTLPAMANLAIRLPQVVQAPIPLMRRGENISVSMTQEQVSCLLANAFFCTFPWRNSKASGKSSANEDLPNINFWRLFNAEGDDVLEKMKCIIHYFRRVAPAVGTKVECPKGVVTFSRRAVPKQDMPDWWSSQVALKLVPLNVDPVGTIERQDAIIQVDFANKYLGGGVLGRGSVQEEIRFSVCPELMASMLFVEKMDDNEAVMMIGAERYNQHMGYSRSFTWMGNYPDGTPFDQSGRRKVAVLAIDAMEFKSKRQEYRRENIVRELNKAWVGFSFFTHHNTNGVIYPGVATGNWGCGAFGGSPQLKSLIQLMACAEVGRPMTYITFGDQKFTDEFYEMYECLCRNNVTVGQLFRHILDFAAKNGELIELYNYLHEAIEGPSSGRSNHQGRSKRSLDKKQQTIPDLMRKESSPDLFSQDDDKSETDSQNKNTDINKTKECYQNRQSTSRMSDIATEMLNSNHKMANTERKMANTERKMADSQNKMENSQKKNADYQQKMTSTEKKMGYSHNKMVDSQKKFCSFQHKIPATESYASDTNTLTDVEKKMTDFPQKTATAETKMADQGHKMATHKTKMASQTSRLFEEIQRFDEENGRLNLSVSNTTDTTPRNSKRTSAVLLDSESSPDEDERQKQMKKKLSKKITDYFRRKPV